NDAYDPAGILIRKGTKENAVHDAEDRCVGANTKGQRQNCNCSESRILTKRSYGEQHVLKETFYSRKGHESPLLKPALRAAQRPSPGAGLSPATVDGIRHSSNPTGFRRCEEQDQIRDLFQFADPADRLTRLAAFHKGGIGILGHARVAMKVGSRHSGIHGVDAYTFWRKLQGCASGELIDGGFADAIGKDVRKGTEAGHTGNVHDISLALNDGGQSKLCQLKYRAHVDVHHQVVVAKRRILDRSASDNSSRVHQKIDSPKIPQHVLNESCSFDLVQQVYRVRLDIRRCNFRQNAFLSTYRRTFYTLFGKFERSSHPDSARGSCNDRDSTVEFHLISPCKLNQPTIMQFPEYQLARRRISRRATHRILAIQDDLRVDSQKMAGLVWICSRPQQ